MVAILTASEKTFFEAVPERQRVGFPLEPLTGNRGSDATTLSYSTH